MRRINLAAATTLVLAAAAGCADTADTQPSDDLEVDLAMRQGDQDATADVTITNVSDHDVQLLSWYLPDAELQEPLFQLIHDGQRVRYIGPVYKRARPDASDYVTLTPGQTITRSVDLAKFYDVSTTGDYSVALTLDNTRLRNTTGHLDSAWVGTHIEGRTEQAAAPRPPKQTCTPEQLAMANAAVPIARGYSAAARDYLAGPASATPRYTTWFGAFASSGWSTASAHFTAIANAFATQTVTFDCSCRQKNVYAFVNTNQPYLINLCGAFWASPESGTDSRAGTLVHEMSHFTVVAGTNDYAYGKTNCQALAVNNPTQALNNADSHEYFAENTPSLQ